MEQASVEKGFAEGAKQDLCGGSKPSKRPSVAINRDVPARSTGQGFPIVSTGPANILAGGMGTNKQVACANLKLRRRVPNRALPALGVYLSWQLSR